MHMHPLFDFTELFVLDLANNHQGSLDHGLKVIRDAGAVVRANGVRAGLKLQFRDLETFIHPAHRESQANPHIGRFLSTKLGREDFRALLDEAKACGLVRIVTPFDETSVGLAVDLGAEVLKVASCSAADWPLLEAVADTGLPVIVSTAGLPLHGIDAVVSFFEHRRVHFALMHCVAVYPTPPERLELNQIELLRRRYPGHAVGFSTHERPENLDAVQVAVAKGSELFERHVASPAPGIVINKYSSTPDQLDAWMKAYARARAMCGGRLGRSPGADDEKASLRSLMRGVYLLHDVAPGEVLGMNDVMFAMPCAEGQMTSGEWKPGTRVTAPFNAGDALRLATADLPVDHVRQLVYSALQQVRAMLNEAHIALPTEFRLEISHHHGMVGFNRVGAVIIDCVNRSYCKKIVVQLPGQWHPNHYHKRKEETFQVLHGELHLDLDGRRRTLAPGDVQVVMPGVWHQFWTDAGVIFEEISTTHFDDDSYYEDKAINRIARSARKTVVDHWGRHQI